MTALFDQSSSSNSLLIISLTSLIPPASRFTLRGLRVSNCSALSIRALDPGLAGGTPPNSFDPGLGGGANLLPDDFVGLEKSCLAEGSVVSEVDAVGGISNHSSPLMSSGRRKNGQRVVSNFSESEASNVDIGTGEDFMTAAMTSLAGRALRLRVVGVAVDPTGDENNLVMSIYGTMIVVFWTYIQVLSATPPSRPSKQRRRISS